MAPGSGKKKIYAAPSAAAAQVYTTLYDSDLADDCLAFLPVNLFTQSGTDPHTATDPEEDLAQMQLMKKFYYRRLPNDLVRISTPYLSMKTNIELKSNYTLGGRSSGMDADFPAIQVGIAQTVLSSRLEVTYKKGNDIYLKQITTLPDFTRDAMPTPGGVNDAEYIRGTAPFYDTAITEILTNSKRILPQNELLDWYDRPQFVVPLSLGGGHLSEITGNYEFITAFIGKRGTNITVAKGIGPGNPFLWKVKWVITFDASGAWKTDNSDVTVDSRAPLDMVFSSSDKAACEVANESYEYTDNGAMAINNAYEIWENVAELT